MGALALAIVGCYRWLMPETRFLGFALNQSRARMRLTLRAEFEAIATGAKLSAQSDQTG